MIEKSQVGAGTLTMLELKARGEGLYSDWDVLASPAAVEVARTQLDSTSFADLCVTMMRASEAIGPWAPGGAAFKERFMRDSHNRAPLAASIVDHFGQELSAPLQPKRQEFRFPREGKNDRHAELFTDYDRVYGSGQFTWAGIRSVTDPAPPVRERLAEVVPEGSVDLWRLTPRDDIEVFEIRDLVDWIRLIEAHSTKKTSEGAKIPSWSAVSESFDVVHLTWIGFVLAHNNDEGAAEAGVIPLRYWEGEQSLWLNPCFSQATPIATPESASPTTEPVIEQILAKGRH
jgi:hypothetical protein